MAGLRGLLAVKALRMEDPAAVTQRHSDDADIRN
jgi:hypothetical protein